MSFLDVVDFAITSVNIATYLPVL